jgi:hypothetical protein
VADIPWSITAMCMVPTAQTAREGKYETTGGVVKFAVGQSGSIVFLAPITMSLPPGRYTPRARLERDDPPNGHPSLLGTNIQLRRRSAAGSAGVENVLVIAAGQGASLLLGETASTPSTGLVEISTRGSMSRNTSTGFRSKSSSKHLRQLKPATQSLDCCSFST